MSTSRQASSEPEPPKVVSMKSRTSSPRLTLTWRSALAWFQAEISRMPVAQRSKSRPSWSARSAMPALGASKNADADGPAQTNAASGTDAGLFGAFLLAVGCMITAFVI